MAKRWRPNMVRKVRFSWTRDKLIYLCGPIDFLPDGGVSWRQRLLDALIRIGVPPQCILDPTDKPLWPGHYLAHSPERGLIQELGIQDDEEGVLRLVQDLAHVDLRMVDMSVCVFAYIPQVGTQGIKDIQNKFEQNLREVKDQDIRAGLNNTFYELFEKYGNMNVSTYGTIHEIVVARQQKKPVFLIWESPKPSLWMKWLVGKDYVFPTIEDAVDRLKAIMSGQVAIDFTDWLLLDLDSNLHDKGLKPCPVQVATP